MTPEPLSACDPEQFSRAVARGHDAQTSQGDRLVALYRRSVEVRQALRDLHGVFDKALADCLTLTAHRVRLRVPWVAQPRSVGHGHRRDSRVST
jgi:hypothetical protein